MIAGDRLSETLTSTQGARHAIAIELKTFAGSPSCGMSDCRRRTGQRPRGADRPIAGGLWCHVDATDVSHRWLDDPVCRWIRWLHALSHGRWESVGISPTIRIGDRFRAILVQPAVHVGGNGLGQPSISELWTSARDGSIGRWDGDTPGNPASDGATREHGRDATAHRLSVPSATEPGITD
jgi:hypothetical protein